MKFTQELIDRTKEFKKEKYAHAAKLSKAGASNVVINECRVSGDNAIRVLNQFSCLLENSKHYDKETNQQFKELAKDAYDRLLVLID